MATRVEAPRKAHIYVQPHREDRHNIVWVTRIDDHSTAVIPTGCRAILEIDGYAFTINDYRQRVEAMHAYEPGAKISVLDRVLTLGLNKTNDKIHDVIFNYEDRGPTAIPPARFQKIVRRTLTRVE